MTRCGRTAARLVACLAAALVASLPTIVVAHPLGNFTVNRYSRVEVGSAAIRVLHVLDFAEIPTVQERQSADGDRSGTVDETEWDAYMARKTDDVRAGLALAVDGRQVPLALESRALHHGIGQGDLPLLRLEMWLTAQVAVTSSEQSVTFRDRNEPARIGWRELVVRAGPDAPIAFVRSTAPTHDLSNELRSYPEDLLQSPLDVRQAEWTYRAGAAAPSEALTRLVPAGPLSRAADPFAALVATPDLSPGVILLAVLASAVLGGMHAASPGHGKTVMAAYLVGTRGSFRHALALAASVTVSHTAGVMALGAVTLLASNIILPEQLYPWLTISSGVIVLTLGLGLIGRALRGTWTDHGHSHGAAGEYLHPDVDADHHHHHGHPHLHTHHYGEPHHHHAGADHHQVGSATLTWRSLFALGLAGGLVPSASALVVLLSAIALGRLGFGIVLIVAFGLGMAAVLTATGVVLVYAGRLVARLIPSDDVPIRRVLNRAVPTLSAATMTLVGAVVTLQGIGSLGGTSALLP